MDNTVERPKMPDYVSVKEAAQILNVSAERVHIYIGTGRIPVVQSAKFKKSHSTYQMVEGEHHDY